MIEQWKEIKDFENYYISNLGRVKNNKNEILKQYKNTKTGYVFVNLYKDEKNHIKTVHRLVAFAFVDNPGDKTEVDHIDNNKDNNKSENLQWVTHKENVNKFIKSNYYNESKQKFKKTCYINKQIKEKEKAIKKRCYIFNNIIFIKYEDIMNYLGKDKPNTRHFLFQNRIKRDYVLLLLNGNIQEIQDLKGNIINKEDLKFYNKNDKYIKSIKMKLILADHDEYGTWYFTNFHNATEATGVIGDKIKLSMYEKKKYKGWLFEWVDNIQVFTNLINPKEEQIYKS